MLGLEFLGFRMLVIVLELIAPDEFFTVYNKWLIIKIKDVWRRRLNEQAR